ncbi:L,D-transpeptidase [Psychrobacter sp. HD31]|uniref:L,D-transpeptidase family protein n=1 Tax=Psychrobacter sp. HD31 TaxID=3112003 RepID=UPI003DA44C2A
MNQQTHNKISINIAQQRLELFVAGKLKKAYSISTAKNGIGSQEGSGCTPLGLHVIANKIGGDQPINSVFVGRIPTGEIYSEELGNQAPERDWILSRILWLTGLEEGCNKGTNEHGICDTYQRYIYIHGTPDTEPMGEPRSHGCVRMRNADIAELYELVEEGDAVIFLEK